MQFGIFTVGDVTPDPTVAPVLVAAREAGPRSLAAPLPPRPWPPAPFWPPP